MRRKSSKVLEEVPVEMALILKSSNEDVSALRCNGIRLVACTVKAHCSRSTCSGPLLTLTMKVKRCLIGSIVKGNVHGLKFLCQRVISDTLSHCFIVSCFIFPMRPMRLLPMSSHSNFLYRSPRERFHSIVVIQYHASFHRPLSRYFQPEAIRHITENDVLFGMFLWSRGEPDSTSPASTRLLFLCRLYRWYSCLSSAEHH